jgi:hypothetical protein
MNKDRKVSAEVLLRKGAGTSPQAVEKVSQQLSQLGLEVLAAGRRSISIQATPAQFEKVFHCALTTAPPRQSGAKDFGPVEAEVRPTSQPVVPPELSNEVESIEVQQPPLLL